LREVIVQTTKGNKAIKCPESWDEITLMQYQRLVTEWDAKDLVKLFSILCGMDYKILSNTHSLTLEEALLESTRFIYEQPQSFKDSDIPKTITINGREIKIPKRLTGLSIGQSILVRQRLDSAKVYEECMSYAIAIYLQPAFDGDDFNGDRAIELEEDVKLMPITQTYSLGFFLLKPLMKYGSSGWKKASLSIIRYLGASVKRGLTWPKRLRLTH
jgi:hypothetical protein